ncbi:MAG: hypothetical protein C0467_06135 [Planctomycetaceae bacterium]|nr:hypothetical protein [Planctomycetaceae bacterium]
MQPPGVTPITSLDTSLNNIGEFVSESASTYGVVRESGSTPFGNFIGNGYGLFAGSGDDGSSGGRSGGFWPADRVMLPNHAPIGQFTEMQYWANLTWSRWIAEKNMLGIGFKKHVTAFVGKMQVAFVRRGHDSGAVSAGMDDDADPLVKAVQQVWDEWCELHDWGQGTEDREKESRVRLLRDGECNIRLGAGERRHDYLPWCRFVEPEQIRYPSGPVRTAGNWQWGRCTRHGDAEEVLATWVADPDRGGSQGEEVPGNEIVYMKAGVDRTIKRGQPEFTPVEDHLQRSLGIIANAGSTSFDQSGIAWIQKYSTATSDQVAAMLRSGQAAYQNQRQADFAQQSPIAIRSYGGNSRVIHSDGNKDWVPGPVSEGVPSYLQVVDATLQGVGFIWGVPDWFSGGGDASFASALVTGSPFVKMTEDRQDVQKGFTKSLAMRVIEIAEGSGRLPPGTSRAVKPVITAMPVIIADEQKQSSVTDMELRNKIIDPQEAIKKRGRDPKVVIANWKAWDKEFPPAPPPGRSSENPNAILGGKAPTPAPPGSAGGDGSEGVDKLFDGVTEGIEPHSFASVHTPLTGRAAFEVLSLARSIRPEDLAEGGCETEPHVTVLYGLHSDDPDDVLPILRLAKPIALRLGHVSVFPGPERDVLKVDVVSEDLRRLNAALAGLPHTNDFPEYQPHATIAYLRPGLGAEYAARMRPVDLDVIMDRIVFSDRASQQVVVPLRTGVAEDARGLVEKDIQVHRGGKTFTQHRKVRSPDAKTSANPTSAPDGKRAQADAEQAKRIVEEVAKALPTEAKNPGVLAKVQSIAAKVSQKVNDFILDHATAFTRLGSALSIAEAFVTTPEDIQKSPWLASKWAGGKTAGDHIADATSDAVGVGIGVPGTVAAKLVSLALTKAFTTIMRFATSKVTESDAIDEVASLIADLMDTIFEAMGLPAGADAGEIAARLRGS